MLNHKISILAILNWLDRKIETCLEDKDLQREHWAFCQIKKKLSPLKQELNEEEIMSIQQSEISYCCSVCKSKGFDNYFDEKTLIAQTKPSFNHLPDPNYSWIEIHFCQKCNTAYRVSNGT